ncbi:type IV pilus modification protein PilV [Undibacterium sp. Jales W-56]|uniref:type IV pilus modification protein PilV n=1 Tax=Undibacterium sp. Jales W-56 TaxID=2897325 RepID=UPI0021D15D83|nr:type IV pilus modification protein PilV [Undibacterium sp. Jales W-56]MCU6433493.1 type IV pilus modification protein PilV [Undibacterium sp. Jales W-56]
MLITKHFIPRHQHGTSLLEVLITLVILAFGLLGLAGLQSKLHTAELESYQRVQAVLLLSDITERINANQPNAASYVTTGTIGTSDSQPASCANIATGSARDICEWSNALKGAGEMSAGKNVGVMLGARGCITQIQAPNPATGVCTPGIYLVSVSWQGMTQTQAPTYTCGQNLYGADTYRRTIATQVSVGLPTCQ